ncbi:MAG TPA: helix-turn-helix domain-containing protein [Vicinamibacterales bacterium]
MAGSSTTTHDHVQRMLEQIHQNYTQRLTLDTLAKTLERQSAYLGRLFREAMGVTVHEYITRARMMFGAAQVRSGVKVEAVALDLGYRSKKNFYRQFKRRFGMTPEAYRQRHDRDGGGRAVEQAPRHRAHQESDAPDSLPQTSLVTSDSPATEPVDPQPAALTRRIVRALISQRVAMLATDETGCCIAANEAAVLITGYSVAELRRMPAADLFHSDIQSDARSRVQILLPASPSLPANAVLRTRSAGAIHVHLTSAENLLGNAEDAMIAASNSPAAHSSL